MKNAILTVLQTAYYPYSKGWKEWTKSNFCLLTDLERYGMEIHISKIFEVVPKDGIMFYNKKDFIDVIKYKLLDHSQLLLYGAFLIETLTYRYVEDG